MNKQEKDDKEKLLTLTFQRLWCLNSKAACCSNNQREDLRSSLSYILRASSCPTLLQAQCYFLLLITCSVICYSEVLILFNVILCKLPKQPM